MLRRFVPFVLIPSVLNVQPVTAQGHLIAERPGCHRCSIETRLLMTIVGSQVLGEPLAAVRQRDGNILISYYPAGSEILEFDKTGKFARTFAKNGKGPGEVRNVTHIAMHLDTIVAFDAGTARLSYWSLQGSFLKATPFAGRVHDSATIRQGMIAVNADIVTPDKVGLPLHILGVGHDLEVSFGASNSGLYRPDFPYQMMRSVTSDGMSRIWSASKTAYEIIGWDLSGRKSTTWVRQVAWFEPYFHRRPIRPDTALRAWLTAIEYIGRDRIAVLVNVPADGWEKHLGRPHKTPTGETVYPYWDADKVHDTVIEVLDVRHGRLVARAKHPAYLLDFIDANHVIGYREDAEGRPAIDIWRIQFQEPGRERGQH